MEKVGCDACVSEGIKGRRLKDPGASTISRVLHTENGTTTNLPIENNAFYSDLNEPPNAAFTVKIEFDYTNGSTADASLSSQGPIHLP